MSRRLWTPDEDAVLRERFPYERTHVVADLLGRTTPAVSYRARALKISKTQTRDQREQAAANLDLTHIYNPTHETAYFLGSALAHGTIAGNRFTLTADSLGVILHARRVLVSDHPIKMRGLRLSIHNADLVEALKPWGLVPNKTEGRWWPQPPMELLCCHLRGFFDGNGYATYTRRGGLRMKFTTGSPLLLGGLATQISTLLGIETPRLETDRGTARGHRIWYYGPNAASIGKIMYAHDGFSLTRKRQPFLDYAAR